MGEQKARKARHYVIVVHGIGEQKQNTTAPEVVHRFAEVRQEKPAGYYRNLLPSYLSAQSVRRGGMGHGLYKVLVHPHLHPRRRGQSFCPGSSG